MDSRDSRLKAIVFNPRRTILTRSMRKREILDTIPRVYDHTITDHNDLPMKTIDKCYCDIHKTPWCRDYETPCYFCRCQRCREMPAVWCPDVNSEATDYCQYCKNDEFKREEASIESGYWPWFYGGSCY